MSSCDSIAISNELFKIATGSQDSNIKIWDTRSKNCVCTLKGHNKTITSLSFSSKGQMLVSTSDDGIVKVWSIMTYKPLGEFKQPDISASVAKFSPTDNSLLVAYKDKRIYMQKIGV
jgi:WD40 repeat protein